jgi:hypothetical protein
MYNGHERENVFPWPSYYGHFNFFESKMNQHSRVAHVRGIDRCTYELELVRGGSLRTFVCECYSFGFAEYTETVENLGRVDLITINSSWCGYTPDAKHACRGDKVGLFKIGDLMAALNKKDYWNYLNAGEKEDFEKRGWI